MPGKGRGATNDSSIFGTSGNDVLDGRGGSFFLSGGKGDDTYFVDDPGDIVSEKNKGGIDTVFSSIDWVANGNVENLTLTGSDDLSATGNDRANLITGNDGSNLLTGGLGDDTLDGGAGIDVARFAGTSDEYQVDASSSGILVTNIATGEVDTLTNIELLAFDDATVDPYKPQSPSPVATDDTGQTNEDEAVIIDLLGNDQGDSIAIIELSDGQLGTVSDNGDGTVTYVPAPDTNGIDSFAYTIRDANGNESTATVEIEVLAVNDAPQANDDQFDVGGDPLLSGSYNVLDNDVDADGDVLSVGAAGANSDNMSAPDEHGQIVFTTESGGSVEMQPDGIFSYTAAQGYSGADSFSYSVIDPAGVQSTASVQLNVAETPPEDPPGDEVPYYVDALVLGGSYRLNYGEPIGTPTTVTYAFADEVPGYYDPTSVQHNNFQSFSTELRETTRSIFDHIESFSGLTFVQVAVEDAEIVLGMADIGSSGLAYLPSGNGVGKVASDVWLDDGFLNSDFAPGSTAYKTLVHEIGHAVGLVHPGLPSGEDTRQFSVMAGNRHETMGLEEPSGFMLYDIAALQYYYGANSTETSGDDTYTFADLDHSVRTIWDAGGRDTIDMSDADFGVRIDLNEGAFSTVDDSGANNIALAYGTEIEDAIGSQHDDIIIGNAADNVIDGGAGNDVLSGGGGADIYQFTQNAGIDTISDFDTTDDQIDLTSTGLSAAEISIVLAENGLVVSFEESSITLENVAAEDDVETWLVV